MAPTYNDVLTAVKDEIREVMADEVKRAIDGRQPVRLLDVRESDEWQAGHLPGAIHIPRGFLEARIEQAVPDRATDLVIYCAGGARSAFAAKTLLDLGYQRVASM